ncbi:MAG: class I SAM-dependent methyltransferase [Actinobacteria bacterium]|nr:class I SAM-dependent methyltransferase [Actinomycetota bacterium]
MRADTATNWDRLAPLYNLQLRLERSALDAAVDVAAFDPADRLLDLGTGTGALLVRLIERRVALAEVTGVDRSPGMLARVPALPDGWRLLRADATDLPLPADRFDVVSAIYVLHLLDPDHRQKLLEEVRRVNGPAGRLIVVVPAPPPVNRLTRMLAPLARLLGCLSPTLLGLRPIDAVAELERCGFAVLETRRVTRGYPSVVVKASFPAA